LTDKYFKIHKEIYEWFNCKFDCFGRTSAKPNHEVTIDIFEKLYKNGYIAEDTTEQAYCEKCGKFLADRFVTGECPYCGYDKATGDQCEKCGKLLNATELVNAKCKICGTKPIVKETKHLFIDLPKIKPELEAWMNKVKQKWSVNARTMTEAWMKEGLKLRSITRDLKWGIPVPLKGYENKVFYSWFDAPIGYIGITKEFRKDWQDWWKNPKDTRLVQFMGKDNIPFHTILFPAFCIGTKDNYTLLDTISVNEYLNYEGGMFSKSRGIGVFGDSAKESGIKADMWRYYILVNRPEKTDTEFSWEDFQQKVNNELVANLGNLANRSLTFLNGNFNGEMPAVSLNEKDEKFLKEIKDAEAEVEDLMEKIELKEALKKIMMISKSANVYFQDNEPWRKIKEDKERAGTSLCVLVNVIKDIAIMIEPFMPETSKQLAEQLGIELPKWKELGKLTLLTGHKLGKPKAIFQKIEEVKTLREKYSGKQKKEETPTMTDKKGAELLNLKVGKVTDAKKHEKADKLLVMQVDLGTEKRQIVAGINGHYKPEEMIGKTIIVVTNLKPTVLRGEESNGMLLAGQDSDGKVGVLSVDAPPGTQVTMENIYPNDSQITIDQFATVNIEARNGKVYCDKKVMKAGEK
jgi:methionyl-tRNA synthetase